MKGCVWVNSAGRQNVVPIDIRRALEELPAVQVYLQPDPRMFPPLTGWDFYLTRTNMSRETVLAATRMHIPIISLPAASPYLAERVAELTKLRDVWVWQATAVGSTP